MLPPPDFESGASTNSATGAARGQQNCNRAVISSFRPIRDRLLWALSADIDLSVADRARIILARAIRSTRLQIRRALTGIDTERSDDYVRRARGGENFRLGATHIGESMAVLSTASVTRLSPPALAALVVAATGAATILGAYFFQYVLGYLPCPLCFEQRIPYYVAIPLALLMTFAVMWSAPRPVVIAGLALLTLIMLVSAGLGAYHAGVEWKWWPGPADCSGPLGGIGSAGDLLQRMQSQIVVSCGDAAWRFLGISLAGYNTLISLALAMVAAWGVVKERERAV
jgi:disulfide bond formation protein DsbB